MESAVLLAANQIIFLSVVVKIHVSVVCALLPACAGRVGRSVCMHVDMHAFLCCLCVSILRSGVVGSSRVDWVCSSHWRRSPKRSFKDAPSLNHVFIASICLTTASQLFLSHDDRYERPSSFRLCSSHLLHVWMSSSVCSLCTSPPNKSASFAWVPEQALLIDLSQD